MCEEYFDFDKRIEGFGELDYEEFINLEKYKGQNYNRYKSRDPSDSKYEVIYQKRLKQIKEDFSDPEAVSYTHLTLPTKRIV